MNRLILLGNGFDLAHDTKTRYSDFLFNYISQGFMDARESGTYDDGLMCIRISFMGGVTWPEFETLQDIFRLVSPVLESKPKNRTTNSDTWLVTNEFIFSLFTQCNEKNWVDIENQYYHFLKDALTNPSPAQRQEKLHELNLSFQLLIEHLEKYLETIKIKKLVATYQLLLDGPIKHEDIVTLDLKQDLIPEKTMVLNFNYTKTVEDYVFRLKDKTDIQVNYIHGALRDKSNPIIFGFGDELDSDYPKLESDSLRDFLKYLKSFWYFRTSNYHNLVRFIGSDDFQVYVWGHSCGLSDRTMLNMIFEHSFCRSIKIFYHQTNSGNNYTELTQEISRHFTNKVQMRNKIVPFDKSIPMPQVQRL